MFGKTERRRRNPKVEKIVEQNICLIHCIQYSPALNKIFNIWNNDFGLISLRRNIITNNLFVFSYCSMAAVDMSLECWPPPCMLKPMDDTFDCRLLPTEGVTGKQSLRSCLMFIGGV